MSDCIDDLADIIYITITPEVFSDAYKTYWRELYIAAYHYTNDEELAKEIIQEVFVSLWERRQTLQLHTSLKSYLYQAMRLKSFEQFRKQTIKDNYVLNQLQKDLRADCTEQNFFYKELETALSTAVDQLPKRCREVYTMSREKGLDNKSIAIALDISIKAVEANMTRALTYLRSCLKIFR